MTFVVIKKHLKNYSYVCKSLKDGKAVVIETDTLVGLLATKQEILYEIKKRPLKKN